MTTFITIPCTAADGSPLDPDTYLVDADEARRWLGSRGLRGW